MRANMEGCLYSAEWNDGMERWNGGMGPSGRGVRMRWLHHRIVQFSLVFFANNMSGGSGVIYPPRRTEQATITAYTGDGTAANPILLEGTPPSPVKILSGPRFRDLAESIAESCSDTDLGDPSADSDSDDGSVQNDAEESHGDASSSCSEEDITMNSLGVPVFERPPEKYSAAMIMKTLLSSNINEKKIAYKRPIQVQYSSTFIIDLTKLAHPDDIKRDAYGRWIQNGSHTDVFKCLYDEDGEVSIDKVAPGASGSDVYYLRRIHCVHPTNSSFRRILAFICDSTNNPHRLCMAVYYLPDNFHPKPVPHGNSKEDKPFFSTLPSTMARIKHECSEAKGPKKVIQEVSADFGGVLSVTDICQLPRGEQQVSQVKRRCKQQSYVSQVGSADDEFAAVLHKAFMEDATKQFVREIKTLREPAIVVATDQQMTDLVRFCTSEGEFGIMTVDPTFSLGQFDVTVTTYRHLLLECRRSGKNPVFIGPSMVHFKKTFSTYLFFASTLVGLQPDLCRLRAFGTDGEEALYSAFHHEFPDSVHLQCFIHVRRNIKDKLQELRVCEGTVQVVLGDIFGRQVELQQMDGLVDAVSEEEFDQGVQCLCQKWEQFDSEDRGPMQVFCEWFKRYKCSTVKHAMLRPVRIKAGLGNPPIAFTTNASESINALLKNQVEYKKNDVPVFLDKLQAAINEQQREVERAIVNTGKYRFCEKYKHLVKSEDDWFLKMTLTQKQNHIKKVASLSVCQQQSFKGKCKLKPKPQNPLPLSTPQEKEVESGVRRRLFVSQAPSTSHKHETYGCSSKQCLSMCDAIQGSSLSVSVESFCNEVIAEEGILKAVWKKAEELVMDSSSIVQAPGGTGFLVKSYSGSRPHHVKVKKGGQYCCDGDCPNWQSLHLCSHTVATAEKEGQLQTFVQWYKKSRPNPNLTKLITTTMPKGRGRKGGIAPPKKKKKLTSTSATRVPFSAVCNSSEQQDGAFESVCTTPDIDFDDDSTVSEDAGTSIGSESIEYASNSNSEESLVHTLTLSSGSSSQAHAGSSFISHSISLPTGQASSRGFVSTNSAMPSVPPPLIPCNTSPANDSPFTLAFISGNIRVCRGCRQRFVKPPSPPHDLCVRHQEWQEFTPVGGSFPQHRYGNVYYHCNLPCILARCASFSPDQLDIPVSVLVRLLPVHTAFIRKHMPGRL